MLEQEKNPRISSFCIYLCSSILISLLVISTIATSQVFSIGPEQYSFVGKWGSKGVGHGSFAQPAGITTDSNDNIYVADLGNAETAVQKFTSNGTFLTSWGSTGLSDGQFINPSGIGVDSKSNIYVADYGENNRVQKFDSNGNFITK